ncbi:MAG TPA: hypothetical protein DCW68_04045 [Rhodospirillaceae bacterium]|nr:MAG: hypothetical protein A2018_07230 [Alphaproteobacteria bacterium GWF2_58_20]HAU29267.1 hypothetical protein [Rhodospirillaceae bacterium]
MESVADPMFPPGPPDILPPCTTNRPGFPRPVFFLAFRGGFAYRKEYIPYSSVVFLDCTLYPGGPLAHFFIIRQELSAHG